MKGRKWLGFNRLLFALFSSSSSDDKQTVGFRCENINFMYKYLEEVLHWKLSHSEGK